MSANTSIQRDVLFSALENDISMVRIKGNWQISQGLQALNLPELTKTKKLVFEEDQLGTWDSSLITYLAECRLYSEKHGIECDFSRMSPGIKKLLAMSQRAPESLKTEHHKKSFVHKVGESAISLYKDMLSMSTFLGESLLSFMRIITGRGQLRLQDLWYLIQDVGANALPIVSLISILVGFIMAFVGAVQLEKFGATIYIADLVALAMVREMGAMMTAIIMCGRTGAAFAATIGSMKVSEELDALKTTGISAMDFVVLPRMIALTLMLPLLCIFSNFIGIIGGFFVAIQIMDLSFVEYYNETKAAINMTDFSIGVTKSIAFGILVALMGCLRGIQCGNDSGSVGVAATSAVVTGITSLIIADAIFAILINALNI